MVTEPEKYTGQNEKNTRPKAFLLFFPLWPLSHAQLAQYQRNMESEPEKYTALPCPSPTCNWPREMGMVTIPLTAAWSPEFPQRLEQSWKILKYSKSDQFSAAQSYQLDLSRTTIRKQKGGNGFFNPFQY